MNALANWNPGLQLAQLSPWWILLLKVTVLLALGWLGHAVLRRGNPRYRLFWWRGVACATVLIAAASFCGPAYFVSVERETLDGAEASAVNRPADRAKTQAVVEGEATKGNLRSVPPDTLAEQMPTPKVSNAARSRTPSTPVVAPRPVRAKRQASVEAVPVAVPETPVVQVQADERDAAATSVGSTWRPSAFQWLGAIWLAGVLLCALRLVLGLYRVRSLLRGAVPADEMLQAVGRRVAMGLGIRGDVEVLRHDDLPSPVLYGMFRPKVIVPSWMTGDEFRADWPAVLAHELSHVQSRDLPWQMLLHAISIPLWFHPLAWRLRRAHLAECERKADLDSAAFLGETRSYIRTLARIALRASTALPQPGLAMARKSDVTRRLAFLKDAVFPKPLRRWRILAAGLLGLAVAASLGSLRFAIAEKSQKPASSRPESAAKKKSAQPKTQKLTVRVLDENGQPVPKAKVRARVLREEPMIRAVDANGAATFDVPAPPPKSMSLKVNSPGRVTASGWWRNYPDRMPQPIPEKLTVRLEKGTRIGGQVVDEAGQPVTGVEIRITAQGREPTPKDPMRQYVYEHLVKTDAKGRWKSPPIIPVKPTRISLLHRHKDFIRDSFGRQIPQVQWPKLRKFTYKSVLKRGRLIEGRVTGPDGKPVAGAVLALGHSPFGALGRHPKPTTDKNGTFRFKNVPDGDTAITVVSKDHAPDLQRIHVSDELDSVNFQLKKGKTLKVRVVNKAGKPVAGAKVVPDTWRGHRSLMGLYEKSLPHRTNKDGLFIWKHAPDDEIEFDVLHRDYMSERDNAVKPRDKEWVITMVDPLRVSGTVVDAKTKKPLPRFTIVEGYRFAGRSSIYWSRYDTTDGRDGKYKLVADTSRPEMFFRAEAKGYKPEISRAIKRDAGKAVIDFQLTKAKGPAGTVVTKAGKPVANAEVHLCLPNGRGPYVRNGAQADRRRATVVKTDKSGRFSLDPQTEVYALLVFAKEGFARVQQSELERNEKIELSPWARVEGIVKVGDKPGAGVELSLNLQQNIKSGEPHMYFDYDTKADEKGRFTFERVPPDMSGVVGKRILIAKYGGSMRIGFSHGKKVVFEPGKTAEVVIGGTGRPVIGQLKVPGADPKKIAWNSGFNHLQKKRPPAPALPGAARPFTPSYTIRIKPDGSFRLEDVPEGEYDLMISVYEESLDNRGFQQRGKRLGSIRKQITIDPIPGGRSDKPLDLGALKLE